MAAAKTSTITKFKKAVKSFIPYGIVYIVKRRNARKKKELVFNKPLSPKAYADKYSAYRSSESVCNNWILYESYGGVGMIGNPWAIFKAFRRRNDFGAFQHIWVILENDELNRLSKEYRNVPNVRFILYGSEAYGYYLARSEYLVNNVSFPFFFAIRPEQHYLNTWHSVTVKALGYDMPDGNRLTNNMERNFLMTDYIVSPNAFMTDIFNQSFKLKEIYDGKYIEQGYPRNDLVIQTDRETIARKLADRGIRIEPGKKIILYAPTWNGTRGNEAPDDTPKYDTLTNYLCSQIDMSRYQILVKPHQYIYKKLTPEQLNSNRYVPATICTNELLSLVDILITDYSSIYFDFLAGPDKPILFFIPDYEQYCETRGLYFSLDELPGPFTGNPDDLVQWIGSIDEISARYADVRRNTKAWACRHDDGHAAERILKVFIDRDESAASVLSVPKTGKKKLLIYPGTFAANGVTSAALNLLNSIDYDRYDVSVFTLDINTEEQIRSFDRLSPKARVFLRISGPNFASGEEAVYKEAILSGFLIPEDKNDMTKYLMEREYCRNFGRARFDSIIDFSGYSPYFPMIALLGKPMDYPTTFFIWQHNDLYTDFNSPEKTSLNKRNWTLDALLSVYDHCDRIVSCGETVLNLNIRNTSNERNRSRFTFVTNLMDAKRARKGLNQTEPVRIPGYYTINKSPDGSAKCSNALDVKLIPFPDHGIHFVTIGRLMPEKNHRNLIKAMQMLINTGTDAYLYIVGDGALREELEQMIRILGLSDRVILTGLISNPFSFIKHCDCFVFPSYYEGQPMTVTEARISGLPIILSPFPTAPSVMMENGQYLLNGMEPKDILEGLQAFAAGEVPHDYHFDVEEYNRKCLHEWNRLLDYAPRKSS